MTSGEKPKPEPPYECAYEHWDIFKWAPNKCDDSVKPIADNAKWCVIPPNKWCLPHNVRWFSTGQSAIDYVIGLRQP